MFACLLIFDENVSFYYKCLVYVTYSRIYEDVNKVYKDDVVKVYYCIPKVPVGLLMRWVYEHVGGGSKAINIAHNCWLQIAVN